MHKEELGISKKLYPVFKSIETMSDQFIKLYYMKSHKQEDKIQIKDSNIAGELDIEKLHKLLYRILKTKYKSLNIDSNICCGDGVRVSLNQVVNVRYFDKEYSWKEQKERFTVYNEKYNNIYYTNPNTSHTIDISSFLSDGFTNGFGGPSCEIYRSLNISILQYNGERSIVVSEGAAITNVRFWEYHDYGMKFAGYKDSCLLFKNEFHTEKVHIAFMSKDINSVLKFLYLYIEKLFIKDLPKLKKNWKAYYKIKSKEDKLMEKEIKKCGYCKLSKLKSRRCKSGIIFGVRRLNEQCKCNTRKGTKGIKASRN